MSPALVCPQCGRVLPEDAPGGLCPACLLQIGLESVPDVLTNTNPAKTTSPAPGPEELATLPPPAPDSWDRLEPDETKVSSGDARAPTGYVIERELGRGGMGVVYLARDVALHRPCALKMILAGVHSGSAEMQRFRTEAQAIARLQHPGIVQVFEIGEHDGKPFMALEYCSGGSLDAKLAKNPLAPKQAAALVKALAEAIDTAHQAQVLHRDLKPANVLLTDKGEPKVTDFGLAKKLDEQGATRTGSVMGTPSYMPPEQAEGKKDIGPTADVYSLGAILYECLASRPPFRAATALDTILQVLTQDPVPVRQLNPQAPADLETICNKCLQKEPWKRYATARELADDLGRYLRGESILARPVSAWEHVAKWMKRQPAVAGLASTAAVLLLTAIGILAWGWQQAANAQAAAEDKASAEQGKTAAETAARKAADQQTKTAKRQAHVFEANLALERGTNHCANGDPARGLLWLVHGLEVAPEDADELREPLRTLLNGWANQLHPLRTILEHEGSVWDVVLSPDGKTVATKSSKGVWVDGNQAWWPVRGKWFPEKEDALLQLWDAVSGKRIGPALVGHKGDVNVMVFSPDSKILVTGGQDKTARRWDTAIGRAIGSALNLSKPVIAVKFSTDAKTFGASDGIRAARLWNTATGQLVREIQPNEAEYNNLFHNGVVESDEFLHDGVWVKVHAPAFHVPTRRALTPGGERTVRVWEGDKPLGAAIRHRSLVRAAAFSADGGTILTVTGQTVWLWEANPNPPLWECEVPQGHEGYPPGILVAVSPDGRTVVTGGGKPVGANARLEVSVAHLRHAASGEIFGKALPCGGIRNLAFSPDGKTILTLDGKGVRLWDAQTGEPQGQPLLDPKGVACAQVSPNGKVIATGTDCGPPDFGGEVRFWDRVTGKPLGEPMQQRGAVVEVVFSPDGQTLLSRSRNEVRLWEVATRNALPFSLPLGPPIHAAAFSPDGKVVLTGNGSLSGTTPGLAQMWDSASGKPIGAPVRHQGYVASVALWPDGQTLFTSGSDGTVRLSDRASGKVRAEPVVTGVRLISLSSHGLFATLSQTGGVQQWDATTVKPVGRPLLPGRGVEGFVMDPDGKTLFAVTLTGNQLKLQAWQMPSRFAKEPVERIRLWVELNTGQELDPEVGLKDLDANAWRLRWERWQKLGGSQ